MTEPDPPELAAEVAFCDEVRRRRLAAGLRQAELTNRVGHSRECVSRAERASTGLASAELAHALDEALGADGHVVSLHVPARRARTARRVGVAGVPYVDAQEGEGWLRLDRPANAIRCFNQALDHLPEAFARDRVICLSRAAVAHLDDRNPDESATTALRAWNLARVTHSMRIRREVHSVGERLAGHRDRPAVAALLTAIATSDPQSA